MPNTSNKNMCHITNQKVKKLIIAFVALSSGYSVGQEMTEAEIQEWRQAVERSTKVLSSENDIYALPPYMVYYTIFRHALVDPNLAIRFPKSDFPNQIWISSEISPRTTMLILPNMHETVLLRPAAE